MTQLQAQQFLEQLQIATYRQWQLPPPKMPDELAIDGIKRFVAIQYPDQSPEEAARTLEYFKSDLDKGKELIPTPYEDPTWYRTMLELSQKIEQAAEEAGMPIPHRPVLGTLPTGQINAMTIRVPGSNDFLILFEWQLFLFALLLSKAVCRALPFAKDDKGLSFSTNMKDVQQRVDADPSVVGRFAEVVIAYAVTGLPSRAPQYFAEAEYNVLANQLLNSVELFAMGHEYGHVISGHLSGETNGTTPQISGAEDAEELDYSWMQEHEADLVGASLMMRSLSSEWDAAFSYWGADFFFSAIDIMDRAVSVLKGQMETPSKLSSHPPSEYRRELLREMLPRMIGDSHAASALQMSEAVHNISELLWERTAPRIVELYNRGVRPAPWWEFV